MKVALNRTGFYSYRLNVEVSYTENILWTVAGHKAEGEEDKLANFENLTKNEDTCSPLTPPLTPTPPPAL